MGTDVSTAQQATLVKPGHDFRSMTASVADVPLKGGFKPQWIVGFACSFLLTMVLLVAVTMLLARGVGIWGLNIPVAWGFAIINFVWWIGIGHAGTLISAFLLLSQQEWRTSINRFAEAMTLFAVACAGLFPLLHLGRPWFFYWLLPYPNNLGLWPQFRSPLVWDVFAVFTYGTISLLFWYLGLLPDLATMRDRAHNIWVKRIYGISALGWRGALRHWQRQQSAYLILAGLAAPLVISVHSIVGMDFAISQVPGWHSTIFPPYFVAGAIYSGFAMVLTITVPLRVIYGFQDFVTKRHLDNMAKLMLVSGLIVTYGYAMELFMAYYSGETAERYMMLNRISGPYWPVFWMVMAFNVLGAVPLWLVRVRQSPMLLFLLSLVINTGMWLERYMIVVTSLRRDYLPSSWGGYQGTIWDWATFAGSLGLFFMLFFLFARLVPMISMSEMRELIGGNS